MDDPESEDDALILGADQVIPDEFVEGVAGSVNGTGSGWGASGTGASSAAITGDGSGAQAQGEVPACSVAASGAL